MIERDGRICYKSEDRITDEQIVEKDGKKVVIPPSYIPFLRMIVGKQHFSVIEHVIVTVLFITDRGVTHELVRHRLASYSQECLSGDTVVKIEHKIPMTIRELYERQNGIGFDKVHNKNIQINSVDDNGFVIKNRVKVVWKKGVQPLYNVKTSLGYSIKATMNHRFLTRKGYECLELLSVGSEIFVNGRPCLLKITDQELTSHYNVDGFNAAEIAARYNIPYRTVLDRLKKIGIFVKHKNDKDKEKYQKNHTDESNEKMRSKILEQYENGRVVWNKGLNEMGNESVRRQADSLRENHHDNQQGEQNSFWKGGVSRGIAYESKKDILKCEICESANNLEIHHKDKNERNNSIGNLIKVCVHCHELLHHGWHVGKKTIVDKIVSIEYVGMDETFDIEMCEPYNYIANGFVVHNSTRYCNYAKGKYGSQITVIDHRKYLKDQESIDIWLDAIEYVEKAYTKLIALDNSPQIARDLLPNVLKTEIICTANLREWGHIFKLRSSANEGAHPCMKALIDPVLAEFRAKIPIIYENLSGF
jgi:thymidylate synthase ThyX